MGQFDTAAVRRYYDRHTAAFLALGQDGASGTIHRAVWGPGVADRFQAFHYVEDTISQLIESLPASANTPPHIVDLGCGVGASLCYLAERLPLRGTGITLSPVQVERAVQQIDKRQLQDRVVCIEGDYSDLPSDVGHADLAYAIESFVHASQPDRFFAQCARLIRPGGLLVICDDFRRAAAKPNAMQTIDRFCRGWHINTLVRTAELRRLADAFGFEHHSTLDLSPFLEIHRLRDRLVSALLAVVERLPLRLESLDYLAGGHALQTCLAQGWIGYELCVFRRVPVAAGTRADT